MHKCQWQDADSDLEGDIDVWPPVKEVEKIDMEGDGDAPCPDKEVRANYNKLQPLLTISKFQDDRLNKHQHGEEPGTKLTKKELTCNILEVMSDKVTVKFKIVVDKSIMKQGWWCNLYKYVNSI